MSAPAWSTGMGQRPGRQAAMPFGGLGDSGNHRPAGFFAVDFCNDPVACLGAERTRHDRPMERCKMNLTEVQVDRLVGPTHHFGGLGVGNVASQSHGGHKSNPAAAATQGLDKMRLVAGMGVPQVVLPPQPRPDLRYLRSLGFRGSNSDVLRQSTGRGTGVIVGGDELFGDVDGQCGNGNSRDRRRMPINDADHRQLGGECSPGRRTGSDDVRSPSSAPFDNFAT